MELAVTVSLFAASAAHPARATSPGRSAEVLAYVGLPNVLAAGECGYSAVLVRRHEFGTTADTPPAHGDMSVAQRHIRAEFASGYWLSVSQPAGGYAVIVWEGVGLPNRRLGGARLRATLHVRSRHGPDARVRNGEAGLPRIRLLPPPRSAGVRGSKREVPAWVQLRFRKRSRPDWACCFHLRAEERTVVSKCQPGPTATFAPRQAAQEIM